MTPEQLTYLIIILSAILIGTIIFFLSCIYYVKKNTVIVIERMEKFFGIYKHGFHFFWPFVYRRRGTYSTNEISKVIRLANGNKAKVTYKIVDVLKYHYGGISIEQFFNKFLYNEQKVTFDLLKKEFSTIGIELLIILQIIN